MTTTPADFTVDAYETIARAIIAVYENKDDEPAKGLSGRAEFAACIVRLAGHDLMDFRQGPGESRGGSDGCLNFDDIDNRGIKECVIQTEIAQVYQNLCQIVSVADFVVIAAQAVMGRTATDANLEEPFTLGTLQR